MFVSNMWRIDRHCGKRFPPGPAGPGARLDYGGMTDKTTSCVIFGAGEYYDETPRIPHGAFVVAAEFISKTFAGKAEYAFVGDESEIK